MSRLWMRGVAAVFVLAACGEDPSTDTGKDAGDPSTTVPRILSRVGPGKLEAYPDDTLDLQAVLSESERPPVANTAVTWKIVLDETGGAELGDRSTNTDDTGVAVNTIKVSSTGKIQLKAESAGATSKASWTIDVLAIEKRVQIVATNETLVTNAASTEGTVSTFVNKQTTLRIRVVQVKDDGERPISGESVQFSIVGATNASQQFQGNTSGQTQTQGDGETTIALAAGTVAAQYKVTASLVTGALATFNVTVGSGGNTTGGCTSTAQCPQGQACLNGQCRDTSIGGNCGNDDTPCPLGYHCNTGSGLCEPGFGTGCESCPAGTQCNTTTNMCEPIDGCDAQNPCPGGFNCVNGACIPNPTDGTLDVTGHWYTKHTFSIKDALPDWVNTTGAVLRTIDQVLLGQLNLPGWVNSLISGVLRQYIPDWVYTVINILDNLATMLSYLRAEGEMDLVASGGPRVLAGQEYWTSFVFYLLAQCNGNIGGNIWQPPPCARVDIYTDELEAADLAVTVKNFSAKLGEDAAVTPHKWTLQVDKRQVELKLVGILKFVLDYVLNLTTGIPSLEDKPCCRPNQTPGPTCGEEGACGPGSGALSQLVDCEAVNEFVSGIIPIDVTNLCRAGVSAIGKVIADKLKNIALTTDVLEFDGQATARPKTNPTYAEELGDAKPDELNNRGEFIHNPGDGLWNSKIKVGVSIKNVPGRWLGRREPIPQQ